MQNRHLLIPSPTGQWSVFNPSRSNDLAPVDRYSVLPLRSGRWGLFDRELNAYVAYGDERKMRNKHMAVVSALRMQSKLEAAE